MSEQPAAGWFPDPSSPDNFRWWDGTAWSSHVTPGDGGQQSAPHSATVLAQTTAHAHAAGQQAAAHAAQTAHQQAVQAAQAQAQHASHQVPATLAHAGQSQALHVVGGGGTAQPHLAGGDFGQQQHQGAIAFDAGKTGRSFSFPGSGLVGSGGLVAKIVGGVVAAAVALTLTTAFDSTADIKLDHTFSTPDKKMTMAMPGKPKHEQKVEAIEGFQLKADLYTYEFSRDRGGIVVGAVDYDQLFAQLPKTERAGVKALMTPKLVLEGASEGAAEESNGTIESKTSTTVSGYPAMELKIRPNDGEGVAEGIIVYVPEESALYMVAIVTRDGDKKLLAKAKKSIRIQA